MNFSQHKPDSPVSKQGTRKDGEDSDEETPAPDHVAPWTKLLQKTPGNAWALGPLPEQHNVLKRDLGEALRVYVTQQWSMSISILLECELIQHSQD